MGVTRAALAIAVALAGPAQAEVDWARGVITAEGIGIPDRHAPSPAVAREPARRRAEDAARARLAAQLPAIPLASGGTLEAARASQLAKVVERAYPIAATPGTDGSWTVTLALPLEAVRQALADTRALPAAGDADPPVVVVEGAVTPALGYVIGGITAPIVWRTELPAWAKGAPRIQATGVKAGVIEVKPAAGSPSARSGGPSTLFVVIRRS